MRSRVPVILVGVIFAAMLALATPAGAANPQNAGLQVALRAQGLYRGSIDALVGPQTVAAVRAFQREQSLPVTGFADKRTRRALGPFGGPLFGARTLRRGMFGWDVAVLQFLLVRQGYRSPLNGYFDVPTARATRRYQLRLRLAADGVAGPATFAAFGLQARVPVPARARVPASAGVYVVRAGDTLTAIALAHRTTVRALARLNRLDAQQALLIGTRLRLPAGRTATATRSAATPGAATSAFVVRASIARWSAHYGVDAHLARALAWMESGFQQNVHSSVGAEGVMQVLPSTWSYVETVLIRRSVPHTVDGNVRVGIAYLDHLLVAFHGNKRLALGAWYQGEAAVREHGFYEETKPFVADVLALRVRM